MKGREVMAIVIFSGSYQLGDEDLCMGVQRIPEIRQCFREAQSCLDAKYSTSAQKHWDLLNAMTADDNQIMKEGVWRDMIMELVQIGLYRRYCRLHGTPSYLIGDCADVSALSFYTGKENMEEWVNAHIKKLKEKRHLQLVPIDEGVPFLVGKSLKKYGAYHFSDDGLTSLKTCEMDLTKLAVMVAEKNKGHKVIHIGSGDIVLNSMQKEYLKTFNVEVLEFIGEDPMLGWFKKTQTA